MMPYFLFILLLMVIPSLFGAVLQVPDPPKSKETREREKFLEAESTDGLNRFTGEGELGFTVTSGNTNTETLNTKLNLVYEKERWRHIADVRIQEAKDNQLTTVNRKVFSAKSDVRITQRSYLYGSFRYEDDPFSGFEFQRSGTVGVGWRAVRTETTRMDIESGAGYKQTQTLLGAESNESILRLYSKYLKKMNSNTQFVQELLIEGAEDNTISESITSLKVGMNESLALKIGLHVKKSSTPPLGSQAVDKATIITLAYGF